jgi:hypothetical protein
VTTAAEYRQFVKECVESARSAPSDEIRKHFLEIAKLWMQVAERMDARAVQATQREKLGHVDGPLPQQSGAGPQ